MNAKEYKIRVDTERLKGIRKKAGMTQTQVANELGISMAAYQSKESGEFGFKDSEKLMIHNLFNMSFQEFDEILYGGMLAKMMF